MMSDNNNGSVKLVMIGDSGVGKSCLCNRFINDEFNDVEATIGGKKGSLYLLLSLFSIIYLGIEYDELV
jgi:GTPase SAR1 family protein